MKREDLEKLNKEELIDIILTMHEQMKLMAERISELEARLNMNSSNSSKPPSSDGFKKQISSRKPSGKKPGAQPGHKGHGFRINREPDETVTHKPDCSGVCVDTGVCKAKWRIGETRYEIDIEIRPIITAHQTMWTICPMTGKYISGEFPVNISGTAQYGVNIEALAVCLNTMGMVSVNRTHEILSSVFNVPISSGTISKMVNDCTVAVAPAVEKIKEALPEEPVLNLDETGIRVDGKNHWAHVASTDKLTYISVQENRGSEGMNKAGILPGYQGIGIHDCFSAYFKYGGMKHGLCNAHLLRELEGITQNYKQDWANKMADLLLDMKRRKEELMLQGGTSAPPHETEAFIESYDTITALALSVNPVLPKDSSQKGRSKRGKAGALTDRLIQRKDEYTLFFKDFSVPFDNNQAERDIRMFKVKQKVSGCFRTKDGANSFASITSFISTARKFGHSAFLAVKGALLGKPLEFVTVECGKLTE